MIIWVYVKYTTQFRMNQLYFAQFYFHGRRIHLNNIHKYIMGGCKHMKLQCYEYNYDGHKSNETKFEL